MPRRLVPLSLLALAGCFLDTGACGYEHRSLVLSGTLAPATAGAPVSATVALNETRNSGADFRVLNLELAGAFGGAITGAELRDTGPEPVVLAVWPGSPWNPNLDLAGASPSHELLADLAAAGRLRLVVSLSVGGAPVAMTSTLSVSDDGDWMHPRCD